jgi:hypothetical protein
LNHFRHSRQPYRRKSKQSNAYQRISRVHCAGGLGEAGAQRARSSKTAQGARNTRGVREEDATRTTRGVWEEDATRGRNRAVSVGGSDYGWSDYGGATTVEATFYCKIEPFQAF